MSLDKLLRSADAAVHLDLVTPPPAREPASALRVPPGAADPRTMTTAAGYLLRFELQRRHPGARAEAWVADYAPERLESIAPELAEPARRILEAAHVAHAEYVRDPSPTDARRADVAAHAFRLARLDAAVRADYADADAGVAEPEVVAELLAMLDATPWDRLAARDVVLQPVLGRHGILVPHAEPDAILDGRLLVVKTTKSAQVTQDDLRHLLMRLILTRGARAEDPGVPEVRSLEILFARHGRLWSTPVAPIVGHEAFGRVERWMLRHAERVRGVPLSAIGADGTIAASEREPGEPPAPDRPRWVRQRIAASKPPPPPAERKAKEKKAVRRGGEPTPPARPPKRSPDGDEPPRARPRSPDDGEAPPRKRPSRPDWRKGSAWRRRYGK